MTLDRRCLWVLGCENCSPLGMQPRCHQRGVTMQLLEDLHHVQLRLSRCAGASRTRHHSCPQQTCLQPAGELPRGMRHAQR